MKVKLLKDLPDYPEGTVLDRDNTHWYYREFPTPEYVSMLIDEHIATGGYTDWFERIDETPLYWEPEVGGGGFWYITSLGDVIHSGAVAVARRHVEIGNAFPTQEAAQAHVDYLKALTRVRAYIQRHYFNSSGRVAITYMPEKGRFDPVWMTEHILPSELPLLRNPTVAEAVIQNCQDDLKTIFGVES